MAMRWWEILLDSSPLPAISNLNLSSDTTAAQYLAQTIDQLDFRFRVAGEFKEENKFVKLIFGSHEFFCYNTILAESVTACLFPFCLDSSPHQEFEKGCIHHRQTNPDFPILELELI